MSPLDTPKYRTALEALAKLGLVPSAIEALADAGPDAVYRELSRRGRVWSIDNHKWRKSLKPRSVPSAIVKGGYLDHAAFRFIVHADEVNGAIAEFTSIMASFGYELTRVNVHEGRSVHECLVYATIHQAANNHG